MVLPNKARIDPLLIKEMSIRHHQGASSFGQYDHWIVVIELYDGDIETCKYESKSSCLQLIKEIKMAAYKSAAAPAEGYWQ